MFDYQLSFILILIASALGIWAQSAVRSNYHKYSKVLNKRGIKGAEAARFILDSNGLDDVEITRIGGELTDHYDPSKKIIALSNGVYDEETISAVAVAAHEVGHAIQDKERYTFLKFREGLFPVVSLASRSFWPMLLIGIILSATSLINFGIVLFAFTVIFQLVTLPVEIDASRRAINNLTSQGIILEDEKSSSKKVLEAAAMTYLAAALMSLTQLFRFYSLYGRNDRD
ncbi:MAG: zinc metallopeptidase [Finegoldia sp.]|nr:zinc metallopeptidase [Finegoldia sp.]